MPTIALQTDRGVRCATQNATALSGIWVAIAAITMAFAAFTSSLIIRQGSGDDWRHLALPGVLYLNTLVLLASSLTLEIARRKDASNLASMRSRLYLTFALGIVFLGGQILAWYQLRAQGLYLATSPNSSFFYVLTVMHALHVLGGLAGFVYAIRRTLSPSLWRTATLDAAATYWHFLAGLWVYLLLVLRMRL